MEAAVYVGIDVSKARLDVYKRQLVRLVSDKARSPGGLDRLSYRTEIGTESSNPSRSATESRPYGFSSCAMY